MRVCYLERMLVAERRIIPSIFPDTVATVVADAASDHHLLPAEEEFVANSMEKRQREFAQGRTCAREALRLLGVDPVAIPSRSDRAPIWPDGVVGTITHTSGLVAAAVARTEDLSAIGLDAEARAQPLKQGLDRFIRTPSERDACVIPAELDPVRLVFSAKESIHKCVAPLSGVRLGFHDVELVFDVAAATFRAVLMTSKHTTLPDFARIEGRFAVTPDYVLTSASIRAGTAPVLPNS
jgi:4'-phosphopantetheinyl transferase EntD